MSFGNVSEGDTQWQDSTVCLNRTSADRVYKKYENEGKTEAGSHLPVDNKGRMTQKPDPFWKGRLYGKRKGRGISALAHEGMLLAKSPFTTSMPIAGAARTCHLPRDRAVVCLPSMISAKMH